MLLIQNGLMIDPASDTEGKFDILTSGSRIVRIAPQITEDEAFAFASDPANKADSPVVMTLDAGGCIVAPGLVDTHSHFRDPGFTYKEDLQSGAAAAAKGGYASVILMANTNPPVDNVETLTDILERGKKTPIHIYSCCNVTIGMKGDTLADLTALSDAGAVGYTDDGKPVMKEEILRQALRIARATGKPVSLHEENPQYIGINGVNEGAASAHYGFKGSDRMAEISMVERDVQMAVEEKAPLCIQHISTAEGVSLVRKARRINPQIHAEATPHHFSLTEQAVIEKGTMARVNPPLRTEDDRMAIIRGLQDGTIDIIATDHAPHADFEKDRPIEKSVSGMIGLEMALSLGIRELVNPGYLSMKDLLRCLTVNPARFYHLPAGRLYEGGPADIVIFDPERRWEVTGENIASKSKNSPLIGEFLPGVVEKTIVSGKIVYDAQKWFGR